MNEIILPSELVLNPDNSVYHLNLFPDEIADLIILVGDPERVPQVSKHFDRIDLKKQKREFVTHTGAIGSTPISVISTGIGTDNIDIVLNELDILVNIDLETRQIKSHNRDLKLVRIGTSGALQPDIEVDSMLVSTHGLGLDNLLWYYKLEHDAHVEFLSADLGLDFVKPYLFNSSEELLNKFDHQSLRGITATCSGFFGPQGRQLRKAILEPNLVGKLAKININGHRVTNFEMETAAILGLSKLFGFKGIAINALVANRINHTFSKDPHLAVEKTIQYALNCLIS